MLLSTDWFLPYWSKIGIQTVEDKRIPIQQGCREIVSQILGDAGDYLHCDHSFERKELTYRRLKELLRIFEAEEAFSLTCQEWELLTHLELSASFSFQLITREAVRSLAVKDRPILDASLLEALRTTWSDRDREADKYLDLCWKSMTSWDAYIREVLGSPLIQSSTLKSFFRHKHFMEFGRQLRSRLSQVQRERLARWYREARALKQR